MRCLSCHADNDDFADVCLSCGQSLAGAFKPGSVVASRYEILTPLGKGGMGMVYKAHDRVLEEEIAIKVLRADVARSPDMARRFRSEIRLARKVTHRNVCRIHEYGEDQGLRYISMELIEGVDLKKVIRERKGGLPEPEAFELSIQIARGLQAIHEVGIVHRDLKTANIMRDARGVVKLMDFGIAKEENAGNTSATAAGDIVGTPEYMSPEQARGQKVDARSDIYALAVVIHEVFSGDVPFRGETPIVTIFKHIQDQPHLEGPGAPAFPPQLLPVLRRGLAKNPDDRFASAEEVADALRAAREQGVAEGRVPPSIPHRLDVTPVPGPIATTPAPAPAGTFGGPATTTPGGPLVSGAAAPAVTPAPFHAAATPTPPPVTPTPRPAPAGVIDTAATHSLEPDTAAGGMPAAATAPGAPVPQPPDLAPPPAAPARPAPARPRETPPPPATAPTPAGEPVRVQRQRTQRIPAPALPPAAPRVEVAVPPARRLLMLLLIAVPLLIMAGGVLVVGRILKGRGPQPSPTPGAVESSPGGRPDVREEVVDVRRPGSAATASPRVAVTVQAPSPLVPDSRPDAGLPTPVPASPPTGMGGPTPPPVESATPPPPPEPSPLATPSPRASARPATPTPPPRSAEPSPELARAQQLVALLGQADAAWADRKYEEAGRYFDEALKLEPSNSRATAGKARSQWAAMAIRRVFTPGLTVNLPARSGKGPAGFDTSDVQVQDQDFMCQIEVELDPPAVRPGGSYDYTVRVSLESVGKKTIKLKSAQAVVTLNGVKSEQALQLLSREVPQRKKLPVAEFAGSWQEGMTAWSLQVVLGGDKGDACRRTINWR